jgi:glucan phosphoethanolaminetransferase (alkaline phosphatase superfamily)
LTQETLIDPTGETVNSGKKMGYLKFIGLGFLVLFAANAADNMIAVWERWRPTFLILTLLDTAINYLLFALIPLSAIYLFRQRSIVFVLLACIGIAAWVYLAGLFYVALTGLQTLQLGQSFHIRDGQMMPALYAPKLWMVLALYAVLEGAIRIGEIRRERVAGRTS